METMQIIFRFPSLFDNVDDSRSFQGVLRVVGLFNWAEKSSPKVMFYLSIKV